MSKKMSQSAEIFVGFISILCFSIAGMVIMLSSVRYYDRTKSILGILGFILGCIWVIGLAGSIMV